jgi:beta-glucosidase
MFSFKWLFIAPLSSFLLFSQSTGKLAAADTRALYLDPNQPIEARVDDLLSRMTLEEKVSLVHADSPFTTAEVPRLGIPERYFSDGPLGVRETMGAQYQPLGLGSDYSTAMPAGICLAATWDTNMARLEGETTGQRHHARAGGQYLSHPVVWKEF